MSKKFNAEVTDPEQMKQLLRDNCDSREETKYLKALTVEELDIKRETLADNSIQLFELEDELKQIKQDFKDRMDPVKEQNRTLLRQIKTRQEEVVGTLYYIANHDDGMMETYDDNGDLVGSRRLRPEERQQRIPYIKKVSGE